MAKMLKISTSVSMAVWYDPTSPGATASRANATSPIARPRQDEVRCARAMLALGLVAMARSAILGHPEETVRACQQEDDHQSEHEEHRKFGQIGSAECVRLSDQEGGD